MKKYNVIEFILVGLLVCTAISCKSASSENTAANDNTRLTNSANSDTIAVEKPLPTPASDPGEKFDAATLIERLKTKPADLQKDLQNKVVTVTGSVRAQNEKIAMYGRDDTAYISCNPTGKTFANGTNYALLIEARADFDTKVTDTLPTAVVNGTVRYVFPAKAGEDAFIVLLNCEIVSIN